MENVKETLLELPWNVVHDCNGFGLDFGKLNYINYLLYYKFALITMIAIIGEVSCNILNAFCILSVDNS